MQPAGQRLHPKAKSIITTRTTRATAQLSRLSDTVAAALYLAVRPPKLPLFSKKKKGSLRGKATREANKTTTNLERLITPLTSTASSNPPTIPNRASSSSVGSTHLSIDFSALHRFVHWLLPAPYHSQPHITNPTHQQRHPSRFVYIRTVCSLSTLSHLISLDQIIFSFFEIPEVVLSASAIP
jgi:hypothetical protein